MENLAELALRSDAIVLAVKPNALERAAEQLGGAGDAIASVLGATSLARLRELFPEVPVVRTMPTITAEVQRGVICHAPLASADGETGARLLNLFGELSHLVEVPDEMMDVATAAMGCTPAYLAIVVQNLAEAGAAEGLGPEQAYELVLESFAGTIELLRRYDPITVRASVASRGGSTEAGLEALADAGVAEGFKSRSRPRSNGCASEAEPDRAKPNRAAVEAPAMRRSPTGRSRTAPLLRRLPVRRSPTGRSRTAPLLRRS